MKVALIGAGSIGARHLQNLIALGVPARDVTAYDPETSRLDALANRFGVVKTDESTAPFDPAVSTKPDLALVCAPARWHAGYVKKLIAARVPFFVEKPATLGVDELTRSEWFTDVPHLVGSNMLYRLEVRRLSSLIDAVDDDIDLSLWCRSDMSTWPGSYGTPLFEFCHEIGIARWLLGVIELSLAASSCDSEGAHVVLKGYRGRQLVIADVVLQWGGGVPYSRGASLSWRSSEHVIESHRYDWRARPSDENLMFLDEMRNLLDVVRGSGYPRHSLASALDVVGICEKVWNGRTVGVV